MRGLLRLVVVAFSIASLMVVAAVGVGASSGKEGSASAAKHSVVALFAGHFDQVGFFERSTKSDSGDDHKGNQGDECKPHKKHHHHATGDHENNRCGDDGDDSGSTG